MILLCFISFGLFIFQINSFPSISKNGSEEAKLRCNTRLNFRFYSLYAAVGWNSIDFTTWWHIANAKSPNEPRLAESLFNWTLKITLHRKTLNPNLNSGNTSFESGQKLNIIFANLSFRNIINNVNRKDAIIIRTLAVWTFISKVETLVHVLIICFL